MNLIVIAGASAPAALVSDALTSRTARADDVTLVSCAQHANATARVWRLKTWLRFKARKRAGVRCAKERIHYLEEWKDRNKAYQKLWREMAQDADTLIVFREIGGEDPDFFAEGMLKAARLFDLTIIEVIY